MSAPKQKNTLKTTTIVGHVRGDRLGRNLSEDSSLFQNPICRWSSCTSCCCERDNSFVPPPGSLSASGKADWPILWDRRKVGGLTRWKDGWKDWRGGAENLASGAQQCHRLDSCAGSWEAVFHAVFCVCASRSGRCINLYVAHAFMRLSAVANLAVRLL